MLKPDDAEGRAQREELELEFLRLNASCKSS
jgi:hypothetical protein